MPRKPRVSAQQKRRDLLRQGITPFDFTKKASQGAADMPMSKKEGNAMSTKASNDRRQPT
jgi:hypothetical protein